MDSTGDYSEKQACIAGWIEEAKKERMRKCERDCQQEFVSLVLKTHTLMACSSDLASIGSIGYVHREAYRCK